MRWRRATQSYRRECATAGTFRTRQSSSAGAARVRRSSIPRTGAPSRWSSRPIPDCSPSFRNEPHDNTIGAPPRRAPGTRSAVDLPGLLPDKSTVYAHPLIQYDRPPSRYRKWLQCMWEIIQAGGPMMWPIIACSIMGGAIVLERLWTLQQKRVLPRELTEQVWRWVQNNQVNDKLISALEQNSPLGRVLAVGLA